MTRFHAVAMTLLVLCAAAALTSASDVAWVRRSLLASCCCSWWPLRCCSCSEKCPRCGARLRTKSLLRLPARCRMCGVAFERPPVSAPLDRALTVERERLVLPCSSPTTASRRLASEKGAKRNTTRMAALAHLDAAEQHIGAQQAGRLAVDLDEPARVVRLVQDENARPHAVDLDFDAIG